MILTAALCATGALLLARRRRATLRVRSAYPSAPLRQDELTPPRPAGAVTGGAVVVGATLLVVGFGSAGVVAAAAVVPVAVVARRRRNRLRARVDVDVALCLDLVAAAMSCGASPATALSAVARGVAGPAGRALGQAATALSLGADPAQTWSGVAAAVPQLAPAARACARAASSGAAVAAELFRLAAAARADAQVEQRRRLQRAGVWLVLPLGLCFLPAFVLVAVVPVVLSAVPALAR